MEKIQKAIVVLLIVAIVFSVITTMLNLSLINLDFKPANAQVLNHVVGNPNGNIELFIEGNNSTSGVTK